MTQPAALALTPLDAGCMVQEYRLEQVLGTGTFGITYKAWDTYLDVPVAIKEFFPRHLVQRLPDGWVAPTSAENAVAYQWVMSRFVGEGQVLARFRHPNIVRVWRYLTENGTAYMVMDFEEGRSLADYLQTLGRLPEETELRRLLVPVLEGLREVHRKRFLHRDIKPGNIFLRNDGPPCLLDFGAADVETAGVRDSANVLTHGYAPLEQYAHRGSLRPASDIYALGATLHRCVSGRVPPDSRARLRALDEGRADPLEPAVVVGRGRFTQDFLELIDWMVSLAQADRPQSVDRIFARLGVNPGAKGPGPAGDGPPLYLHHRVLVAGPRGAGVRTAIAALCGGRATTRDARAVFGERVPPGEGVTWGAFDLSPSERLHLYGLTLPEQSALLDAGLQRGALGLLLLVDNGAPDPFRDLDLGLRWLERLPAGGRMAVGVTHCDEQGQPPVSQYHARLRDAGASAAVRTLPLFEVDARSARDLSLLMQALLYSIDPGAEPGA
jgi:signal recognition particle receptor subunit beta